MYSVWGREIFTNSKSFSFSSLIFLSIADLISSFSPSPKYSFGTPIFIFPELLSNLVYSATAFSDEVESFSSFPEMTSKINAKSSMLFANGPMQSKDEANAVSP